MKSVKNDVYSTAFDFPWAKTANRINNQFDEVATVAGIRVGIRDQIIHDTTEMGYPWFGGWLGGRR